jgi:hypothetical protein
MADNVVLSAPVGTGDTIAADDVSGVKYQLVQLVVGSDGGAKSLVTGSIALPVGDAGGSLTVDNAGTFAVQAAQSGSWTVDTELPAAAALADAAANPTTPLMGACLLAFNGSTWDRLRGDTANGLDVDVTRVSGTVAVTQSGTWVFTPNPATSGGLTISRTLSASSTNATSVKASAGQVYGWYVSNTNSSARYLKLYNKASRRRSGAIHRS